MSDPTDDLIEEGRSAALAFVRPIGDRGDEELTPDEWQQAFAFTLARAARRERMLMWVIYGLTFLLLTLVIDPILDFLGPIIDVAVQQVRRLFSPG